MSIKHGMFIRKIASQLPNNNTNNTNKQNNANTESARDVVKRRSVPNIDYLERGLHMLGVDKGDISYVPGINILGYQLRPDKVRISGTPDRGWITFSNPSGSYDIKKAVEKQYTDIQRRRATRLGEQYDPSKFYGVDLRQYAGNGLPAPLGPIFKGIYNLFGKLGLSGKPKGYTEYELLDGPINFLGIRSGGYADHNNIKTWSGAVVPPLSGDSASPVGYANLFGHEGTPALGHLGVGSTLFTHVGDITRNKVSSLVNKRSEPSADMFVGKDGVFYYKPEPSDAQNTENNYLMHATDMAGLLNRLKAELNRSAASRGVGQVTSRFGRSVWDTKVASDGSRNFVPALVEAGYLHRDNDGYFSAPVLKQRGIRSKLPYFGNSVSEQELVELSRILNRMVDLEREIPTLDTTTKEQLERKTRLESEYNDLYLFFKEIYPLARNGRNITREKLPA